MNQAGSAQEEIFIVDDDDAMRDSLTWLVKSKNLRVRCFGSAEAFLDAYSDRMAGCLVLDVRMPGMSGLELYDKLAARGSSLPVIFVTGHGDVPMAVSTIKKGAVDFIEKPFNHREMMGLIEHCLEQDRQRRALRRQGDSAAGRLAQLTRREREVVDLIIAGKLSKQIADIMGISIKTVETHRAHIMEKMAVDTLAELVSAALKGGAGR